MEIQELVLKHYGKFDNHRIALKPGVNIIYGGNESGKTTIHSFIRSMFFGLNRGRGRAARADEYQIRQPWETPGAFLGSMRVCENGQIYRIDRCFDRSTQPLQVTCESEGWEAERPEEVIAALTGGISEAAFVNTVFIPQAHCETDEALAQELQRYMVNTDNAGDGELDVTRALAKLRRKKKQLEQKQKKENEQQETLIAEKQQQAESLRAELGRLRAEAARYTMGNGTDYGSKHRSVTGFGGRDYSGNGRGNEDDRNYGGYGGGSGRNNVNDSDYDWDDEEYGVDDAPVSDRSRRILEVLLFVAGLLALAGALLLEGLAMRIFLGVFAAIFLGMIFIVHFALSGHSDSGPQQDASAPCPPHLLEAVSSREEQYQKLLDELEALYSSDVRLDGADTEIAALNLAIDRICELSSGIYQESGGRLNETASRILSEITGGRYSRIVMNDLSEVRIHTPDRVLGLHQVSGGTMQQIYFALRMAAGELLSGGRTLPVVLDETFAMYDDARLEAVLRWLKKSRRQVILFTCQKREREILARLE